MNAQYIFLFTVRVVFILQGEKRSGRVKIGYPVCYMFRSFILHESFVVHRSSVSHWKTAIYYTKREWFEAQLQFFDQLQIVLLFVVRPKNKKEKQPALMHIYYIFRPFYAFMS